MGSFCCWAFLFPATPGVHTPLACAARITDSSLSNILAGGGLAGAKVDDLKRKVNILYAFTAEKAEEAKQAAQQAAKDLKDEL